MTARGLRARGFFGLLCLCILGLAIFTGTGAPVAGADEGGGCPNEDRRLEQGSTYLPDCRAYEMVTPVDKDGNDGITPVVSTVRSAPDGNAFIYRANPAYADSTVGGVGGQYMARRSSSGWSVNSIQVPPTSGEATLFTGGTFPVDASVDLSTTLLTSSPPLVAADEDKAPDVYSRDNAGGVEWLSQGPLPRSTGVEARYAGGSADSSHVVFSTEDHLLPEDAPRTAGQSLYDRSESQLNLVSVKPDGTVFTCGAVLGDGDYSFGGTMGAVSADGSRMFFQTPDPAGSGDPECGQPTRLYARVNGTETIEVSAPEHVDPEGPQPVTYMGASRDGSKVFFLTQEQLTADDPGHAPELYEYDLEAEDLKRISGGPTGTAVGNVAGLLQVSADGSHVYFLAQGELVPGEGTPGAYNIYLYSEGETRFIASTPGPLNLVAGRRERETLSSVNGEVLAYQALPDGESLAAPKEVYVYDDRVEEVHCVSCGAVNPKEGSDAYLHGSPKGVYTLGLQRLQQTVSDDGSRVFFTTPSSLVQRDTNEERDVYEWEAPGVGSCTEAGPAFSSEAAGCIYILSSGKSEAPSIFVDASSDGSTMFIGTYEPLVGQDGDNLLDVYAVRVDGGQPAPPAAAPCDEANCRAPGGGADNAGHVGSLSFSGPGNPHPRRSSKGALRIMKVGRAARARAARTGRLDLAIRTRSRSAITVKAVARIGGGRKSVAKQRLRHPSVGVVHVHLRLAKAARRWLQRNGSLTLLIKARQAGVPGAKSARLVLRRAGGR